LIRCAFANLALLTAGLTGFLRRLGAVTDLLDVFVGFFPVADGFLPAAAGVFVDFAKVFFVVCEAVDSVESDALAAPLLDLLPSIGVATRSAQSSTATMRAGVPAKVEEKDEFIVPL
jgi:hypothetical protein